MMFLMPVHFVRLHPAVSVISIVVLMTRDHRKDDKRWQPYDKLMTQSALRDEGWENCQFQALATVSAAHVRGQDHSEDGRC